MNSPTKHLILAAFSATVLAAPTSAAEPALKAQANATAVTVTAGDRPVLSYHFGDVPFKPYVDRLFTPQGVQVLRDAPHDHLHHHGLMFALVADGVDFWGEWPQCGRQLGPPPNISTQHGTDDGRVALATKLAWTPKDSEQPLVIEQRTITVHGDVPGATLLTWQSELAPAPGHDAITLSGTHYDGLGVRMVESMDGVGTFKYASGEPGPIVRGTERVTGTSWATYTAPVDGRTVTVALFDDPKNARHPAGMFTMLTPFAYLSATPNVWKEPMEVKSGQPVTFRYGVALWDGQPDRGMIEALYRKWLETRP